MMSCVRRFRCRLAVTRTQQFFDLVPSRRRLDRQSPFHPLGDGFTIGSGGSIEEGEGHRKRQFSRQSFDPIGSRVA
jgi:hypothetical protein